MVQYKKQTNKFGKKQVLLNKSNFSFWFTLFIFRAVICSLKMSKYFVHWQVSKPYGLAIVLVYSFWNFFITFTHVFTGVRTGNMPLVSDHALLLDLVTSCVNSVQSISTMWNKQCIKILSLLLTYDYIPFLGLLQLKT